MAVSILAVDDSASMRPMVCCTLKGAGYDVVEAEDGMQVPDIAKAQSLDLVINHVNLPKMNGTALLCELRTLLRHRFTPLSPLTTESGAEGRQPGKAVGVTCWLEKPFDPERHLSTVRKVLG